MLIIERSCIDAYLINEDMNMMIMLSYDER
jgi:hypothetical protein